jgi:hypothetical protein
MRTILSTLLGGTLLLAAACDLAPDVDCGDGRCDDKGSLDGREDPIAKLLRAKAVEGTDGGLFLHGDLRPLAQAMADQQGCAFETWKSFIISDNLVPADGSNGNPFPRVISTMCASEPARASELFVSFSFRNGETGDINTRDLEMFAWDPVAGIYRFYKTEATDEGERLGAGLAADDAMRVTIDPTECRDCHLTPKDLPSGGMRMTPIMNELTQPWSHWNSQVPMFDDSNGLTSHEFHLPPDVVTKPNFKRFGVDRAAAASDFEQIIRNGHGRVAGERMKERRVVATDWKQAMNLLRPMFCEEQVQYATEDVGSSGGTGQVLVTTLIPGGVREAFKVKGVNEAWGWLANQDGRMRLQPQATHPPVFMIPVRGNADVDYENRVLQSAVLTPEQILRVRALDWKRPVLSDLRCDLWRDALKRYEAKAPTLDLTKKNAEHMKVLFEDIMTVNVGGKRRSIAGPDGRLLALDQATSAAAGRGALAAAITAGTADGACAAGKVCAPTVLEWGAILDAYVDGFEAGDADATRAEMHKMRDTRLCRIRKSFPNAPAMPKDMKCN